VVWKGAEVEGREGGRWTLKWGSEEMPFDGMKGLGEDAKGSIGRGGQGAGGGGVNAGAEEPGGVRRKGGRDTGGTEAPVKMRGVSRMHAGCRCCWGQTQVTTPRTMAGEWGRTACWVFAHVQPCSQFTLTGFELCYFSLLFTLVVIQRRKRKVQAPLAPTSTQYNGKLFGDETMSAIYRIPTVATQ
jgi:hypothetical protein